MLRRMFVFLFLIGLAGGQVFHPTRVMMKWKAMQMRSLYTPTIDVVNFNSTSTATKFYKNNKEQLDVFVHDFKMKLGVVKRDTLMNLQWYLDTVNVRNTWKFSMGRSDVLIALIDSGYDFRNLDINRNIYVNTRERIDKIDNDMNMAVDDINGYNFGYVCCDNTTTCFDECLCRARDYQSGRPIDVDGHGTNIAGIVGAGQNNGGIVGIAPNIKILPIKVTDCYGDIWSSSVIAAIEYAISMKANVLSCSFGDIYPYQYHPDKPAPEYYKILKNLYIQAVNKAKASNIIIVASAGNDDTDLDYLYSKGYTYSPCLIGRDVDNVICVGSTTRTGRVSNFSNFGKRSIHTWAPGEDIFTTGLNNQYVRVYGTSFAAPMVTGVIALGLSYLKQVKKSVPVKIIKEMIINATDRVLDAGKFIRALQGL